MAAFSRGWVCGSVRGAAVSCGWAGGAGLASKAACV